MGRNAKEITEARRLNNPGKTSKSEIDRKTGTGKYDPALFVLVKPEMVKKLKRASGLWDEMSSLMIPQGLLTALDVPIFARYCVCLAKAYDLEEKIEREQIKNSNNTASLAPDMQLLKFYWEQVATYASHLGLTPKARKAMHVILRAPQTVKDAQQETKARIRSKG